MKKTRTLALALGVAVLVFSDCTSKDPPIVVVSKILKQERASAMGVPDEFSSFAPASQGFNAWIEGSVRNDGTAPASNVEISFRCIEGSNTRVLTAIVKSLPPGKPVPFRTRIFQSKTGLTLMEEEPEIRSGD